MTLVAAFSSAASIAIALDEAISNGELKKGSLIILVAFGAGLTWGVIACSPLQSQR
ncbi:MAG: hypothetical protein JSW47_21140 [Phycisphaerales bacterium]|nr:MAG: hypothetical protein JSW47_21140 [Phycisphaerales bacterium]UCF17156.1 MAG: hypothetical protein JSW59_06790 [Phycisphaerales bacterium]